MSIPAWRKSEYTDDGCSVYQCLSCYKTWEGRSNPEWEGWNFCPVCGVGWEYQIKNEDDKTFERRQRRYNYLDRKSEVTLEIKHYEKDSAGFYQCFIDWEYVSYGIRFMDLPPHTDKRTKEQYPDLNDVYKEYLYRIMIANKIKNLAMDYSDQNKLCDGFFMFSDGYELRMKIVSRMTGETKYIDLSKRILPVLRKTKKPGT